MQGPAADIAIEAREIIKMRERLNQIIATETDSRLSEFEGHRTKLLDVGLRGGRIRPRPQDRQLNRGTEVE